MATDPICGMFVEERTAELTLLRENRTYFFCSSSCLEQFASPETELARLRRRLLVAWPAAIAVLLLTYAYTPTWGRFGSFLLAGVVEFYAGAGFFRGTYDALRSRIWNMDILIAVGTLTAFAYSAVVVFFPGVLPPSVYFDASALIVALILTGNYLEHLTRQRASQALRRLQELLPTTVRRLRAGEETAVPIAEVVPGDRLRIRAGERVPVDALVVVGESSADESLVTGESLPVEKRPGSTVVAGSLNGGGTLEVEARQVGEDTLLASIGRLVVEAESSQVPLQRTANRIAERFVPAVLGFAVAAALGWFVSGAGLTVALLVFVSVAITACPCAFGIATPAALMVGTGRAAEEGVLFRGRDAIERTARIDTVLTDKTGTLTRGRPTLTDLVVTEGTTEEEALGLALGLEQDSSHPFAAAVRGLGALRRVEPISVTSVRTESGAGLRGLRGGTPVSLERGSVDALPPTTSERVASAARRADSEGKSWSLLFEDGRVLGLLAFSDPAAPGVKAAVTELESEGIRVIMATGDHAAAAGTIAREVGIREVHADLTPGAKLGLLRSLQAEGRRVAVVGDGINDAPALLAADAGIAIGAGTDVAKESGQVILVRSDFSAVPVALRAGRRTLRKVRQNLFWALGYNAVLLPVAAGAVVPLFGLSVFSVLPIVGALAMGLSSTSVLLNSLSLRREIRPPASVSTKP
ncbi:MAG TPA: heavy metal translocating P-type ATPase [Thermoplasmata archaeon]|nr:heavy metal translocating P-type ATPase [Thermoplasmata archaeon]